MTARDFGPWSSSPLDTDRYCVCGRRAATDLPRCGHYECDLYACGFAALTLLPWDGEGWRHALHGEPLHCGTPLQLQHAAPARPLAPETEPPTIVVRYEVALGALTDHARPRALLYIELGGHHAVIAAQPHMRLRYLYRGGVLL